MKNGSDEGNVINGEGVTPACMLAVDTRVL
jgi:hypothetical protein